MHVLERHPRQPEGLERGVVALDQMRGGNPHQPAEAQAFADQFFHQPSSP